MKSLDINLTKSLELCFLYAFPQCLQWRILKKTILYSGFKNPYKNFRKNKETLVYS
jgi:hypothetical protein